MVPLSTTRRSNVLLKPSPGKKERMMCIRQKSISRKQDRIIMTDLYEENNASFDVSITGVEGQRQPQQHVVADQYEQELEPKPQQSPRRRRKRVRFFGLVAVMNHRLKPASEMTPEEKEAVWWQKEDMKRFENHARVLCTETRKRGPTTQSSYKHTLSTAYEACEAAGKGGLSEHQQHMLNQWIQVSPARRGLERFCTQNLYSVLKLRKMASVRSVLHAQKDLPVNLTPEERAEYLRSIYVKLVAAPVAYARALGKADENASGSQPTILRNVGSSKERARHHDPVQLFVKTKQPRHTRMSIPGPLGIVRRLSGQRC